MFGQPSPMDTLEARLAEAIELLDRCGERYWVLRLNMALKGVRANRLGGVSQVLGFFGGEGFILQKLEGDGMAFLHAGGTVVEVAGSGLELPGARGLFCQFGGAEPVAAT